jgi:hypothetical protein
MAVENHEQLTGILEYKNQYRWKHRFM